MVKHNSNTENSGSSFNGQTVTLYEQINVYKFKYIIDHHEDFNLHELFHATSADHRDELLQEMMTSHEMSRDEVKELINGGGIPVEDLNNYPDSIVQFWVEMKDIRTKVMEMEPEIVDMARRKKQRNNASNWNLRGSVMNLKLCDIENQVLMTMEDYLTQVGYSVEVLVFDGLMVRIDSSKSIDETVVTECSAYIADKIGWNCGLVVKPMNEHLDVPEEPVVNVTYETDDEDGV
jgi:hypothetical protein